MDGGGGGACVCVCVWGWGGGGEVVFSQLVARLERTKRGMKRGNKD